MCRAPQRNAANARRRKTYEVCLCVRVYVCVYARVLRVVCAWSCCASAWCGVLVVWCAQVCRRACWLYVFCLFCAYMCLYMRLWCVLVRLYGARLYVSGARTRASALYCACLCLCVLISVLMFVLRRSCVHCVRSCTRRSSSQAFVRWYVVYAHTRTYNHAHTHARTYLQARTRTILQTCAHIHHLSQHFTHIFAHSHHILQHCMHFCITFSQTCIQHPQHAQLILYSQILLCFERPLCGIRPYKGM